MNINNIIGIMSCKGGVGKSTLSFALAFVLANFYKKKVGLLDADINGPNHSRLLDIKEDIKIVLNNDKFIPINKYGIKSMSMGYFLSSNNKSVLLRGPMISNTIKYLLTKTQWDDIEILIIDFPPGTGDIYLSILKEINISKILLITTPQILSIDDVERSILMLNKFSMSIFGIIENMKYLECNNCKCTNYLFGKNNNVLNLKNKYNIKNKYEIPFYTYIPDMNDYLSNLSLDNNLVYILKKISNDLLM
jgi:ATP-binding protein involved in chromosome partitioning